MTTYEAKASRDGRFWFLEVPQIGHCTQSRNLAEAETMVRDLVAIMLDIDPSTFDVTVTVQLPASVVTHLEQSAELREEAGRAQHQAAAEVRLAARELRDRGLTVRDIGRALDVSYQRAHQLLATSA